MSALAVSYGIWLVIDWYDCFFLDWVLFANVKAVRSPGTEDMDKAYHQKRYHVIRSLWGMLLGLIPCLMLLYCRYRWMLYCSLIRTCWEDMTRSRKLCCGAVAKIR